jgi:hypothetical protein
MRRMSVTVAKNSCNHYFSSKQTVFEENLTHTRGIWTPKERQASPGPIDLSLRMGMGGRASSLLLRKESPRDSLYGLQGEKSGTLPPSGSRRRESTHFKPHTLSLSPITPIILESFKRRGPGAGNQSLICLALITSCWAAWSSR